MKKSLQTYLNCMFALFIFTSTVNMSAQALTVTYPLTANGTPSITGSGATATAIAKGADFGTVGYSGNGAASSVTYSNGLNNDGYFEYKITPAAGKTYTMQSIAFDYNSSASITGAVYYSTDNFATRTQVGSNFSSNSTLNTFTSGALNVSVVSGNTVSVRVYGWHGSFFATRTFRNRGVVISGSTCNTITYVTQPASNTTICSGSTLTLTASAPNASSFQWALDGVPISGATASTYSKNNATVGDSGNYTVIASGCGTLQSNTAAVTVNPGPTNPTATAATPIICLGGSSQLNASATPVPVIVNGTNSNSFAIPENNSTGIISNIIIPATCAVATNVFSVNVNITHPYNGDLDITLIAPNGSQINLSDDNGGNGNNYAATFQTGGATLPTGNSTISGTFNPEQAFSELTGTAAGTWSLRVSDDAANDIGTLTSWSITIVNATCGTVTYSWAPATGLSSTTIANPIASPASNTTYTVTMTSGGCSTTANTSVTVNQTSVAGAVSTNQTICSGTQPANITIGTSTGTIQWQSSTDNSVFNNIVGQTANTLTGVTIGNLNATRYYRAVVTSGVCSSVNSNVVTVNVNQPSVGGNVSGSTTVCAFSNSGTLTLTGNVGNIVKWQSSDVANFSVGVLDIPNATASLSYLNLSGTTYYRAVITNGVCATAFSSVATITVDNAATGGTLVGAATVCYGNNSGSLTLSGHSGTIIGWESSLNNFATTGIPVANTTTTINYSNLLATTYYRAKLSGGTCGNVYSAIGVITVDVNTTWTGAVSNSWHNAANWSCGVVPTSDLNVAITAVTNQPQITTSDAFANSITFDATTTLLVSADNNLRVVNAILGLTDAKLTIESNANVIQENDVDNTIIANVTRTSNPLMRLDYTLWSSPVDNQNLLGFSSATIPTRFYIYNAGTDLYNSVTPSTTNFEEGTGYLIRMPDNHPIAPTTWNGVFEGTLRNGTVDVTVGSGTYNAIGNPYPSTIDADDFILDNNLTEALYFWRKTNNSTTTSYATYTLAGGAGTQANGADPLNITPNGIIQVGQGFIAKATSSTLSFTNGMRVGNNDNQFFRSEIERNRIWLNLTNTAGIFSQTMVSYMTGATMGVDAAIDGKYFNDSQLALTSIIENAEYAVQGRSLPFENTDIVPLGFKAINAGTYTIGIDHTDGLFADATQNIFLKDNLTNTIHDLRASDYTFASEAGAFNGRFEMVYQMTLATSNPSFDATQVVVYKQSNTIIINTGKIVMDKVQLFDIRGRLITEKANINAADATLFAGATNQVIVVKITSKEGQVVTKKVVN